MNTNCTSTRLFLKAEMSDSSLRPVLPERALLKIFTNEMSAPRRSLPSPMIYVRRGPLFFPSTCPGSRELSSSGSFSSDSVAAFELMRLGDLTRSRFLPVVFPSGPSQIRPLLSRRQAFVQVDFKGFSNRPAPPFGVSELSLDALRNPPSNASRRPIETRCG